ncbi:MAG: Rieske 2Fe-2S domain-containing protein [Rubrobacteraceae bacterium]
MVELQKDPMTRSDFLGFGLVGTVMGALLAIPSAAFVLSPIIKTNLLGESDISEEWQEVGPISEVPEDEPKVFEVEFPINQVYGERKIQEEFPEAQKSERGFVVKNAIWLSWHTPHNAGGGKGKAQRPSFLDQKSEGFSESEAQEIKKNLNVLSNSCAHLGCPVRWLVVGGEGEFLCPCHGGIYDINGDYVAGPPPRGMYRYTKTEIREDGKLYVKHEYDIKKGIPGISTQEPYVV